MIFKAEIKEDEVQKQIDEQLAAKTKRNINDAVQSWDTSQFIKEKVKLALGKVIDETLRTKLNGAREEIDTMVDKAIDSLIKSKVKKAMKVKEE